MPETKFRTESRTRSKSIPAKRSCLACKKTTGTAKTKNAEVMCSFSDSSVIPAGEEHSSHDGDAQCVVAISNLSKRHNFLPLTDSFADILANQPATVDSKSNITRYSARVDFKAPLKTRGPSCPSTSHLAWPEDWQGGNQHQQLSCSGRPVAKTKPDSKGRGANESKNKEVTETCGYKPWTSDVCKTTGSSTHERNITNGSALGVPRRQCTLAPTEAYKKKVKGEKAVCHGDGVRDSKKPSVLPGKTKKDNDGIKTRATSLSPKKIKKKRTPESRQTTTITGDQQGFSEEQKSQLSTVQESAIMPASTGGSIPCKLISYLHCQKSDDIKPKPLIMIKGMLDKPVKEQELISLLHRHSEVLHQQIDQVEALPSPERLSSNSLKTAEATITALDLPHNCPNSPGEKKVRTIYVQPERDLDTDEENCLVEQILSQFSPGLSRRHSDLNPVAPGEDAAHIRLRRSRSNLVQVDSKKFVRKPSLTNMITIDRQRNERDWPGLRIESFSPISGSTVSKAGSRSPETVMSSPKTKPSGKVTESGKPHKRGEELLCENKGWPFSPSTSYRTLDPLKEGMVSGERYNTTSPLLQVRYNAPTRWGARPALATKMTLAKKAMLHWISSGKSRASFSPAVLARGKAQRVKRGKMSSKTTHEIISPRLAEQGRTLPCPSERKRSMERKKGNEATAEADELCSIFPLIGVLHPTVTIKGKRKRNHGPKQEHQTSSRPTSKQNKSAPHKVLAEKERPQIPLSEMANCRSETLSACGIRLSSDRDHIETKTTVSARDGEDRRTFMQTTNQRADQIAQPHVSSRLLSNLSQEIKQIPGNSEADVQAVAGSCAKILEHAGTPLSPPPNPPPPPEPRRSVVGAWPVMRQLMPPEGTDKPQGAGEDSSSWRRQDTPLGQRRVAHLREKLALEKIFTDYNSGNIPSFKPANSDTHSKQSTWSERAEVSSQDPEVSPREDSTENVSLEDTLQKYLRHDLKKSGRETRDSARSPIRSTRVAEIQAKLALESLLSKRSSHRQAHPQSTETCCGKQEGEDVVPFQPLSRNSVKKRHAHPRHTQLTTRDIAYWTTRSRSATPTSREQIILQELEDTGFSDRSDLLRETNGYQHECCDLPDNSAVPCFENCSQNLIRHSDEESTEQSQSLTFETIGKSHLSKHLKNIWTITEHKSLARSNGIDQPAEVAVGISPANSRLDPSSNIAQIAGQTNDQVRMKTLLYCRNCKRHAFSASDRKEAKGRCTICSKENIKHRPRGNGGLDFVHFAALTENERNTNSMTKTSSPSCAIKMLNPNNTDRRRQAGTMRERKEEGGRLTPANNNQWRGQTTSCTCKNRVISQTGEQRNEDSPTVTLSQLSHLITQPFWTPEGSWSDTVVPANIAPIVRQSFSEVGLISSPGPYMGTGSTKRMLSKKKYEKQNALLSSYMIFNILGYLKNHLLLNKARQPSEFFTSQPEILSSSKSPSAATGEATVDKAQAKTMKSSSKKCQGLGDIKSLAIAIPHTCALGGSRATIEGSMTANSLSLTKCRHKRCSKLWKCGNSACRLRPSSHLDCSKAIQKNSTNSTIKSNSNKLLVLGKKKHNSNRKMPAILFDGKASELSSLKARLPIPKESKSSCHLSASEKTSERKTFQWGKVRAKTRASLSRVVHYLDALLACEREKQNSEIFTDHQEKEFNNGISLSCDHEIASSQPVQQNYSSGSVGAKSGCDGSAKRTINNLPLEKITDDDSECQFNKQTVNQKIATLDLHFEPIAREGGDQQTPTRVNQNARLSPLLSASSAGGDQINASTSIGSKDDNLTASTAHSMTNLLYKNSTKRLDSQEEWEREANLQILGGYLGQAVHSPNLFFSYWMDSQAYKLSNNFQKSDNCHSHAWGEKHKSQNIPLDLSMKKQAENAIHPGPFTDYEEMPEHSPAIQFSKNNALPQLLQDPLLNLSKKGSSGISLTKDLPRYFSQMPNTLASLVQFPGDLTFSHCALTASELTPLSWHVPHWAPQQDTCLLPVRNEDLNRQLGCPTNPNRLQDVHTDHAIVQPICNSQRKTSSQSRDEEKSGANKGDMYRCRYSKGRDIYHQSVVGGKLHAKYPRVTGPERNCVTCPHQDCPRMGQNSSKPFKGYDWQTADNTIPGDKVADCELPAASCPGPSCFTTKGTRERKHTTQRTSKSSSLTSDSHKNAIRRQGLRVDKPTDDLNHKCTLPGQAYASQEENHGRAKLEEVFCPRHFKYDMPFEPGTVDDPFIQAVPKDADHVRSVCTGLHKFLYTIKLTSSENVHRRIAQSKDCMERLSQLLQEKTQDCEHSTSSQCEGMTQRDIQSEERPGDSQAATVNTLGNGIRNAVSLCDLVSRKMAVEEGNSDDEEDNSDDEEDDSDDTHTFFNILDDRLISWASRYFSPDIQEVIREQMIARSFQEGCQTDETSLEDPDNTSDQISENQEFDMEEFDTQEEVDLPLDLTSSSSHDLARAWGVDESIRKQPMSATEGLAGVDATSQKTCCSQPGKQESAVEDQSSLPVTGFSSIISCGEEGIDQTSYSESFHSCMSGPQSSG